MEEYEFGVLEDRIISLCEAARPDYEAIYRQIEDGANVNADNKHGEAFLSKIFLAWRSRILAKFRKEHPPLILKL